MTCEEFRHQLLIDPYCVDAAFRDHARACDECALATEDALRFEKTLYAALDAEAPSPGAPNPPRHGPAPSRIRYALLFLPLLLVALWLGLRVGLGPAANGDLGATVIAHIQSEKGHLQAVGTVPWARLRLLFGGLGADANPSVGPVRFAGRCVIGERDGVHLVLSGERGAVTALFMPGRDTTGQREVAGGGLEGTLVPTGFGSLAVVGEPGEPLEPIARRLLSAVRWNGPEKE
jgi:hypothetical protein